MAIEPIELNAITPIVDDKKLPTTEMIKIIQQLISIVRDQEARIAALEP